jgi:uncharacterized membrane protein YkvA (DUF1232 family)
MGETMATRSTDFEESMITELTNFIRNQACVLSITDLDRLVGRSRDLAEEPVAEAAFALLYFQRATDLIPDPIPSMGLLDDAMIVSIVLRRQEHAFKRSLHGHMLRWPEPKFDVDQLLSVVSPLRVTSFCSPSARQPPVANPRQSHWR